MMKIHRHEGSFFYSKTPCSLLLLSLALAQSALHQVGDGQQMPQPGGYYSEPMAPPPSMQPTPAQSYAQDFRAILDQLKATDHCRTFYMSKLHGFDVHEYTVTTKDHYILKLHRLIHPEDQATNGPDHRRKNPKKPYLLLHGLVGSSASFVRNVDPAYLSPERSFNIDQAVHDIIGSKAAKRQQGSYHGGPADELDSAWQSTADRLQASFKGDTWASLDELTWKQRVSGTKPKRQFAKLNPIDYDVDSTVFGSKFKQHYKKWDLPNSSKEHISNSLAFTLSNLDYDVWMINLRGNYYSRGYDGPGSAANKEEYWDFDADKLMREDLLASINFVRQLTNFKPPMGLVCYSYSSIYALRLLTDIPDYQLSLQPVVMIAPSLLTSNSNRGTKFKYFLQSATKLLTAHNGPFPSGNGKARALGGGGGGQENKLQRIACALPVASTLCRLIETVLYGRVKSAKDILFDDDQGQLVKRDIDCGKTSSAVLRQIMGNMAQSNILPKYQPSVKARNRVMSGGRLRRSVILIRSEADAIATPVEVDKIRDSALARMALVDYVVKVPDFGHTDFLFSKRNQYLVNGEIGRMVALFDYMIYRPSDNVVRDRDS